MQLTTGHDISVPRNDFQTDTKNRENGQIDTRLQDNAQPAPAASHQFPTHSLAHIGPTVAPCGS